MGGVETRHHNQANNSPWGIFTVEKQISSVENLLGKCIKTQSKMLRGGINEGKKNRRTDPGNPTRD